MANSSEYLYYKLPCGLTIKYRSFSDPYIIAESGKKLPFYFSHEDIRKTDTILDIGGHIGITALWGSTLAKQVVVCEPEPENFALLTENCAGLENVTLINKFVGADGGAEKVTLYLGNKDLSSHSAYISRGRKRSVVVETVRISELMEKYKPDVLKMDCEGSEYELMMGGLFRNHEPDVITFEAHFSKKLWHRLFSNFLKILREKGYTVLGKEESTGWPLMIHASRRI